MAKRKDELIRTLNLQPHPEGGYFRETYRSTGKISTVDSDFPDNRNLCTAIYYLLGSDDISRFHRIKSDEIWHHYEGSPITIHIIHPHGKYQKMHAGDQVARNQKPQQIVPANAWFGVTVDRPDSFALCGCTVAPGFDFVDFEMANRSDMLRAFPQHAEIIKQLTDEAA